MYRKRRYHKLGIVAPAVCAFAGVRMGSWTEIPAALRATFAALPFYHDCIAGGAAVAAFVGVAIFYFRTTVEDYNGRAVKAGYSMSPHAIQRFRYAWKMWSFAFTGTWHAYHVRDEGGLPCSSSASTGASRSWNHRGKAGRYPERRPCTPRSWSDWRRSP